MEIKNTFSKGIMDKASDERFLQDGTYRDAKNILCTGVSEDTAGVIRRIKGTSLKQTMSTLSDNATCIGIGEYKNMVYIFMVDYSVNSLTRIYEYDTIEDSLLRIFFADVGSVNGDGSYNYIRSIDFSPDGDLLIWTDGVNEIRCISISRAKTGYYNLESHVLSMLAKPVPFSEPSVIAYRNNSLTDFPFPVQFSYRYRYTDSSISSKSFLTKTFFSQTPDDHNIDDSRYTFAFGVNGSWVDASKTGSGFVLIENLGTIAPIRAVSCNGAGNIIVGIYGKNVLISNNFGVSFKVAYYSDEHDLSSVRSTSISRDGKHMCLVFNSPSNSFIISNDYGESWTRTTPFDSSIPYKTAMSDDGKYIYVACHDGVWRSMNYGVNFTHINDSLVSGGFPSIACSHDGSIVAVGTIENSYAETKISISFDYMETINLNETMSSGGTASQIDVCMEKYASKGEEFVVYAAIVDGTNTLLRKGEVMYGASISASTLYSITSTTTVINADCDAYGDRVVMASGNDSIVVSNRDASSVVVTDVGVSAHVCCSGAPIIKSNIDSYSNYYNSFDISTEYIPDYVESIDILCRDVYTDSFYLLKNKKRTESVSGIIKYTASSKDVLIAISEDYVNMKYSNIPRTADSLKIVGNRLVVGAYRDYGSHTDASITLSANEENGGVYYFGNTKSSPSTYHSVKVFDIDVSEYKKGDSIYCDLSYSKGTSITYKKTAFILNEDYSSVSDLYDDYIEFIEDEIPCTASKVTGGIEISLTYYYADRFSSNTPLRYVSWDNCITPSSDQRVGIIWYDSANRSSTVTGLSNISIPPSNGKAASITALVREDDAPSWAVKYRFVLNGGNTYYKSILKPFDVFSDSEYVYIEKPDGVSVSSEDSFKVVSSNSSDVGVGIEIPIVDVVDDIEDRDGSYIKIRGFDIQGLSAGDVYIGRNDYYDSVFAITSEKIDNLYYEYPETFRISASSGIVRGNVSNSSGSGTSAESKLTIGNFIYNNTLYPSNYVNSLPFTSYGTAHIYTESASSEKRTASITWSDAFAESTNYNGLSTFNLSLINYVDLKKEYGDIEYLGERNNKLFIVQHDRIGFGDIDRVIYSSASGDQSVGLSDTFFEKAAYNNYKGEWGCQDYRSIQSYGNQTWMVDRKRRKVLRLSNDGITPISENLMSDYFNNNINSSLADIIGSFDPVNKLYFLGLKSSSGFDTLAWSEESKGWVSRFNFIPDASINNGADMFSVKGNKMYKHNTGDASSFYGTTFDAYIKLVANKYPSTIKIFNNIMLEGSDAWDTVIKTNLNQSTTIASGAYDEREGFWTAAILGNNADKSVATKGLDTMGLGVCSADDDNGSVLMSFGYKISKYAVGVGDNIYSVTGDGNRYVGVVVSVDYDNSEIIITYGDDIASADLPTLVDNKFVFSRKNSYIDGENMRGYNASIELTYSDEGDVELFSVDTNVDESKI